MHRFHVFLARFLGVALNRFLLATAIFLSSQAYAHPLGFSYNSHPLDWQWTNYDGVPNDDIGTNVDIYFGFVFSLDPSAAVGNGQYTITEFDVSLPPGVGDEYHVQLDTIGQIDLGEDGSIIGWDFSFTLTNFLTPLEGPDAWQNFYLRGSSQAGPDSCNCDTLRMDYYVSYQRQNHTIPLGPMEIFYRHSNDVANWNQQAQEVPAPSTLVLCAMGIVIIALRRRRKASFSLSKPRGVRFAARK